MVTLPFLKRKSTKEKALKKERARLEEEKKEKKKERKKQVKVESKRVSPKSSIAFKILKEPIVSEKTTSLEKQGKYVFNVFPKANKVQIKEAIEQIYDTKVEKVNIVKIPGKKRRLGRIEGVKPGYKKAIVTLKKGERIKVIER
ncbi:50S ribosomal protein L23 [bacterium]|nr:50S ribosomal protein L23 [bacterium]